MADPVRADRPGDRDVDVLQMALASVSEVLVAKDELIAQLRWLHAEAAFERDCYLHTLAYVVTRLGLPESAVDDAGLVGETLRRHLREGEHARSALEEVLQARANVLEVLRAEIDLPRRVRADMDAWEANGGKIPPGCYRVYAEIRVEQREGYEVLVPGAIEHGKKVGCLLNLGPVLLERRDPLTVAPSGRPAAQEAAAPGPHHPMGSPEGHFRPAPQRDQLPAQSTSTAAQESTAVPYAGEHADDCQGCEQVPGAIHCAAQEAGEPQRKVHGPMWRETPCTTCGCDACDCDDDLPADLVLDVGSLPQEIELGPNWTTDDGSEVQR